MKKPHHIYLLTLSHASNDMCSGALPALLPFFIKAYGLSYAQAATLVFASAIASSVLQPFFGYFSDKFSRSYFISLGIFLSGLGVSLMGFTSSYHALFICAIISGIGSAIFHPEAAKMTNSISSQDSKAKGMSLFAVGGNIGFAVGPLLAGFIVHYVGFYALITFGLVCSSVAVVFLYTLPSIKRLSQKVANSVKNTSNLVATNDWRMFARLSFVIFARSIIFFTLNTFIPIYWINVLHQSTTTASSALAILFSFGVVVTIIGGAITDKLGNIKMLRYAYMAMVPILFAFTQSTNVYLSTLLLFFVGGAVFAPYSATVLLGQHYLARNIGFASGVTLGLGVSIGGIITPLVGKFADNYGLENAMQILWIVAIVGLVASFTLRPKKV
ncbi:MFS transporter [Campylobacter sp. faydin G-140]|uniref:MFS transporter n=1 Tax=Campylobacter anatolicus TaxID=2829105 RepID=UPI001B9257F2|nr:MFS transporter [Campylobacter anatolicus]MBR8465144.1 MFS transporter [Campylobacter anatolicus]